MTVLESRRTLLLPLAVAIGGAAVVFAPILGDYFHQDDFVNLQAIVNEPLAQYVLRPFGGHLLVVRNLLFFLFYGAFGTHVEWWFAVVLLHHLLNVGLLFALLFRITRSAALACFGALLWGTAPVQEGALGWYSVYGQVVVVTVILLVLLGMTARWRAGDRLRLGETLLWCALALLGATAFGMGVAVALFLPIAIWLLFPRAPLGVRLGVLLLWPIVGGGYWAAHKLFAEQFHDRAYFDFLMLLALSSYWANGAAMLPHLWAAGASALVSGLAYTPASYPSATGYVLGGLVAAAIVVGLIVAAPRERRLLLALTGMVLAIYAVIAAGRATLYAQTAPAYGAALPRYHHAVTIPLVAILCLLLARLAAALRPPAWTGTALLVGWVLVAAGLYARTPWRIELHRADRTFTQQAITRIERAIRDAPPGQTVVLPNEHVPPVIHDGYVGSAALFTIFFPRDVGRRVRFVEADDAVRARAAPGSRLAAVLVPPPSVPPP
jgi:hypothetical protein